MKKKILLFVLLVLLLVTMGFSLYAEGQQETKPKEFNILCHTVHQQVLTGEIGGDKITPWAESNPQIIKLNWNLLDISPLVEKLFRECSGKSTDIDVGFVSSPYLTNRIVNMFEPLNDYLTNDPIDGFEENFSATMLDSVTFDGKIYAMPMRAANQAFMWNETLFNERGLTRAPQTPEEVYEYAKKLTYKQTDGTQVYGYIVQNYYYTDVINIARMWDGDFITGDMEVVCNQEPMVKAIELFSRMYQEGLMPPNTPQIMHAEKQRLVQAGIAAMTFDVPGKIYFWNKDAKYPTLRIATYPLSAETRAKYPDGPPGSVEYWAMVIPKNSTRKDLSWEFIKQVSSHEVSLSMAMNGNGPIRASVFKEAEFKKMVPFADVLEEISFNARLPIPAFDKTEQAIDLINFYIEKAMLGKMTPKVAMDNLAEELKSLISQLK